MASNIAAAKLPVKGLRNILVTSALPYVNNVPHLGNIIGSVLSADVFARYCRGRGYNVIYMCGTDEYGTATENKALEENLTPREICDKYHALHRKVYEWFDIKFDKFGRTSTPEQTTICQDIFQSLLAKEQLVQNTVEQLFCERCEKFLADRFVYGTCPKCLKQARGDQCEKCSHMLDSPTELIDPKCKICASSPQVRESEHLFLNLPKLNSKLVDYVNKTSAAGNWSANAIQITNGLLKEGLRPRCITRDLKWGVPVPLENFKEKVFYVWYDAPIGYLSITATYTPEWEKWWKSPDDVELFQFMGKDNTNFHTILFPSALLGTEQNWTLMRTINVTEYLNYEGGKFSKTEGVGVFGTDVQDTKVPVEVWRYYLLASRPEQSDTVFNWSDLQAKQNNELLKNLGNFVHRCLSFLSKPEGQGYGSVIPSTPGAEGHDLTIQLGKEVSQEVERYLEDMEKVKLKSGLKIAMNISGLGNGYLQNSQFWRLYKEDPASCALVLRTSIGLVKLLAILLEPFMPSFSLKVLEQLNLPLSELAFPSDVSKLWSLVEEGHVIGCPEPIFGEMSDHEVAEYRNRFAGSQADRAERAAAQDEPAKPTKPVNQKAVNKKQDTGNKKQDATKKTPKGTASVANVDIRVGQIKSVKKHPDADSLYVEEIDVGEETPRTVVSGLVKFIPIEQMESRRVCVVCNLKPAKMRGVLSQAMVLAASNKDHSEVELLEPPEEAAVGERVLVSGFEGEPDEVLKKKDWDTVQVDFGTSEDLLGTYKGAPLSTTVGACKVKSIKLGSLG